MKRMLAFGCHPDDVEFQCAGTLALLARRGYEIHIATIDRRRARHGGVPVAGDSRDPAEGGRQRRRRDRRAVPLRGRLRPRGRVQRRVPPRRRPRHARGGPVPRLHAPAGGLPRGPRGDLEAGPDGGVRRADPELRLPRADPPGFGRAVSLLLERVRKQGPLRPAAAADLLRGNLLRAQGQGQDAGLPRLAAQLVEAPSSRGPATSRK